MKFKKYFLIILGFFTSLFSLKDFKRFLNDNSGGLILPFGGKTYEDPEWLEYRFLKIDKSVKSINPEDLPSDFCPKACRIVDEFHRKTVHEDVEWMLYFDYTTGEVVYCWKGGKGKIDGNYNRKYLKINILSQYIVTRRICTRSHLRIILTFCLMILRIMKSSLH